MAKAQARGRQDGSNPLLPAPGEDLLTGKSTEPRSAGPSVKVWPPVQEMAGQGEVMLAALPSFLTIFEAVPVICGLCNPFF